MKKYETSEEKPAMLNEPTVAYGNAPCVPPVAEEKRQSFHEAAKECNAVPVSDFTNELRRQIDEHFDRNA